MRQRIKPDFIEFMEENKDKDYVSKIDENIPLSEQTLNENTKLLLAIIYRDYLCSESTREEIIEEEKNEIEEIEKVLNETYALRFEEKKINQVAKDKIALTSSKKDNIIKKIFAKIKELLKIK